jgi:hypothetical protein
MITTILASWRLANLLVNEDGPFAVFARLRYAAGIRPLPVMSMEEMGGGELQARTFAMNTLAEGLTCVWCVSVWTAALFLLAAKVPGCAIVRRILAVSAGAILVHETIDRLQ